MALFESSYTTACPLPVRAETKHSSSIRTVTQTLTKGFAVRIAFECSSLRVLGSNPGQSFGRGLSGPQATEVSMDPVGSWAATNLTVPSSNSFLGPPFWVRASGFPRELHFLMLVCFFAFSNLRKVRGFRSSLGGPNYGRYRGEATFFFFPTLRTFFLA